MKIPRKTCYPFLGARAPLGIARAKKKKSQKSFKQAGAELGQAQLKLVLDFSLIVYRFVLSRFGLIVLAGLIKFCRCDWIDLVLYILNILLGKIDFVDSVL